MNICRSVSKLHLSGVGGVPANTLTIKTVELESVRFMVLNNVYLSLNCELDIIIGV